MADTPPPPPPPPPSAGGEQPAPTALEPVGPWPRFGARVVDALVLLIPNTIIAAIIGGGDAFSVGGDFRAWFAGVVTTLVTFAYYVYLESTRGQTVGKMLLNLRTVGPDGGNPSVDQAGRRNAWLLVSLLPLLGGIISVVIAIVIAVTISNDPFKRGWHDNFAGGTAVIRSR